jgi:hypothetical protein
MMSDRERWIVYPLLFLAIGFGLKSQWPRPDDLECRSVRCKNIVVDNLDGTPCIRLGSTQVQAGEIRLYGAARQPVMTLGADRGGNQGIVETFDASRNQRVVMGSDATGGFVRLFGQPNVPSLFLGHDGRHEILGVLALNEQDKPLVLTHKDRSVVWGLQVPVPRVQTQTETTPPGGEAEANGEPGKEPSASEASTAREDVGRTGEEGGQRSSATEGEPADPPPLSDNPPAKANNPDGEKDMPAEADAPDPASAQPSGSTD